MTEQTNGVSRRRVIQGAAWATPAILIATGSPPAAASINEPSQIAVPTPTTQFTWDGGPGRQIHISNIVVSGTGLAANAPITDIRVRISVGSPSTATAPTITAGAAVWTYEGSSTAGTTHTFTYRYTGTLNSSTTSTAPLAITVGASGHGNFSATVSVAAEGTSAGQSV
ncbi:hypothetical protein QQX13_07335 [Demequina sp. SYSU T00068]|uniref:hypothetical protein n=1 Tax=Demequina lignilytica TaxID=3051663 RepID=UPI002603E1A6|nr:hypothetical protein [Demequina sp. SYSU T00068]MDN4490642.1 hypothetical protein [Demequina sp. SYSU T00068]